METDVNIPRKITISAASTVAAVLAATGIAMAAPTAPGDADWMDEMHANGWADGDMDAMHARMGEMLEKYPQMQPHMEPNAPLRGQGR